MKNLFIIPARSGSKGIIDKNIQPINGIPLFVWSIIHAKYMSSSGDYICVSSDSDKYLSIAENWGADPLKEVKNYLQILHLLNQLWKMLSINMS